MQNLRTSRNEISKDFLNMVPVQKPRKKRIRMCNDESQGDEFAKKFENLIENADCKVDAFFGALYREYFTTVEAKFAAVDAMISSVEKRGITNGINYENALNAYLTAVGHIRNGAEAHANKDYFKALTCLKDACEALDNLKTFINYA